LIIITIKWNIIIGDWNLSFSYVVKESIKTKIIKWEFCFYDIFAGSGKGLYEIEIVLKFENGLRKYIVNGLIKIIGYLEV
jgi:hypothetical protein